MLHKQIHFRKYRCPWCGDERITLDSTVVANHKHDRFKTCAKCQEQYDIKYSLPQWVSLLIVLLFFIIYVVSSYYLCAMDYNLLPLLLVIPTIAGSIGTLYAHNYFFMRLVRIKNDLYLPFTYQGYMEITPVDKKVRRFIKDGAILAVRYVSPDAPFRVDWGDDAEQENKEETEFPIVIGNDIQAYKPGLWEWEFLQPEKVPDELFQEGREVILIDNGREVAKGLITTVFEEFRKE